MAFVLLSPFLPGSSYLEELSQKWLNAQPPPPLLLASLADFLR